MVLEGQTRWKLHRRQWTGTTEQLIEDLKSAYDNALNMFYIRIYHGGKFRSYPDRVYVSGHVNIFDMVDIGLFTIVALNMMVVKLGYTGESDPLSYNYLRPLTSLDEGLYALACEEVRCLATLVRSFKLIEVYIKHGVMALDCYIRPPRFRATIKDITDEPGSIIENRTKKSGIGVERSRLDHDESFGVDDLELNLNELVNLNVSQIKTQSELPVSEESNVGRPQKPIMAEVRTQDPIVEKVRTQEPIVEDVVLEGSRYVSWKKMEEYTKKWNLNEEVNSNSKVPDICTLFWP
nr:hypothetical protein [Tanacetum cinerariifolium]